MKSDDDVRRRDRECEPSERDARKFVHVKAAMRVRGLAKVAFITIATSQALTAAFASLAANTPFYNATLAAAMWFGRFATIVPVLALAGSLAPKVRRAAGPGTLPTHGPLFVVMLIGTILLMTLLTYLPALALGPIVEQVTMGAVH